MSRKGRRIAHRLRSVKLRAGDVIVLRGNLAAMPETLGELHCLPLAERDLRMGRRVSLLPIAILAAAMALVAFNVVPVAVAFFGAAVILLRPLALAARGLRRHRMADSDHARRADPGQQRLAHHGRHGFDRVSALGTMRFPHADRASMQHAGDGPGGYRFGDYWRLGLPLSIIVLIVGVPLIAFFWSI